MRRKLQEIGVQRRILFLVFGWERGEHAWMLREPGKKQRLKKQERVRRWGGGRKYKGEETVPSTSGAGKTG